MEANPAFLVQCMQKLHYIDPGYRLSFAGTFESPILEQYIRHMVRTLNLTDVITFEPSCGDLNHWLSDKHFIVASGIGESQVEALLAGMACGLKPVVHNFPGADKLFPPQYLFNIAEQFCEQVLARDYEPEQYRRFVEQTLPDRRAVEQGQRNSPARSRPRSSPVRDAPCGMRRARLPPSARTMSPRRTT